MHTGRIVVHRPFPSVPLRRKRQALRRRPLTAANMLDAYAAAFGDRPAIYVDRELALSGRHERCLTYRDLQHHAARMAAAYHEMGLSRGDPVAFLTANRVELAVAVFAALRAGLVCVPLSFLTTPQETASAIERSGARTLVVDRDTLAGIDVPEGLLDRMLLLDRGRADDTVPSLPDLADAATGLDPVGVTDEETGLIFFTSGTTGEPKGAAISHGALAWVIGRQARIAATLPTSRQQLTLLVMPLAHSGGFVTLMINTCLGVPSLVLSRFKARNVLETIERERPTIFAGSPTMYRLLLEAGAEGYDLSSIRIWGGGADVFDRELLDRLRALGGWRRAGLRFKPFTMIGYGASETTGQVTMSPPIPIGERCIGWVLPGFDHRVVDDYGAKVRRGGTGELCLRGGSLMSGYWGDLELPMDDGWFHTGDIVRRGRFGLLYYESRRKDVIKSGGYSIAAREIERVLEDHPAVSQAAAVGLPDALKGERPVAAVCLRPDADGVTADDLETWAAQRLAAYKRPRRVHIMDALPVSATMKPKKSEIKELLASRESPDRIPGTVRA